MGCFKVQRVQKVLCDTILRCEKPQNPEKNKKKFSEKKGKRQKKRNRKDEEEKTTYVKSAKCLCQTGFYEAKTKHHDTYPNQSAQIVRPPTHFVRFKTN